MRNRPKYIFIAFILLLGSALITQLILKLNPTPLSYYGQQLETSVQEQEGQLLEVFANKPLLEQLIQQSFESLGALPLQMPVLEDLNQQSFSILIYDQNRLLFWSQNQTIPSPETLDLLNENPQRRLFKLKNGYYLIRQRPLQLEEKEYSIVGLVPIRLEYPIQSVFLQNRFVHTNFYPQSIGIEAPNGAPLIHDLSGNPIGTLTGPAFIRPFKFQVILLFLYFFTGILLLLLINEVSQHFAQRFNPWIGSAFLLATILFARLALYQLPLPDWFDRIGFFQQLSSIYVLRGTLADLLLNSVLLFWMVLFFSKEFNVTPPLQAKNPTKLAIIALNYTVILACLMFLIRIIKSLVLESNLVFDFDNILNFNAYSVLALVSIILLMMAMFLFTLKMLQTTQKVKIPFLHKLLALGVATALTIPLIHSFSLQLPAIGVVALAIIYLFTFELFIDNPIPGFTWLVIWVSIFSALTAGLLFKYNLSKDLEHRLQFAKQVSNIEDPQTIANFEALYQKLKDNTSVQKSIIEAQKGRQEGFSIREKIDSLFQQVEALQVRFYYDHLTDQKMIDQLSKEFQNVNNQGLATKLAEGGKFEYLMPIAWPERHDTLQAVTAYFWFRPINPQPSKVYSELLLLTDTKQDTSQYPYAFKIYRNNEEVMRSGILNENWLPKAVALAPQQHINIVNSEQADLIFKGNNGNIVIVRKQLGGIIKPLSLFSYLFVLNIFLLILFNGINWLFRVFPESLVFEILGRPSLKNRIQSAVVLLTIGSFIVIAVVTATFFRNSSIDYHYKRLQRKINAVAENLQYEIDQSKPYGPLKIDFQALATSASNIHNMDVNIYDQNGGLVASSAPQMAENGIVAAVMNPGAYFPLRDQQETLKIIDEKLGSLTYQAAYIPIQLATNQRLGYLGLPYYSRNRDLSNDVFDFMGTLLNAYVFLFLFAGIIAIVVANSITKPLVEIGDKLRGIRLGKNEPLSWDSKDELGELIKQYNQMIFTLEEHTEKLRVTEREGAWREMAKQIAHEIKNPLTPMKLNIQYLIRAYQSNPENIAPMLKRVSQTLIDQIDGLSRIASEFSNFAKMPKAKNHVFNLNELLHSIYDLFRKNQNDQLLIELNLPSQQIEVFADKDHLMRVFNNLVKNAIQAIPEERFGKISISLHTIPEKGTVIAEVKDNGIGISMSMQEKVFYPNFTTKNSGMGLGLAISKNIIDAANGRIYFNTMVNQGTSFFVELPVDQKSIEAVES